MLSESFDLPESLVEMARRILKESSEEKEVGKKSEEIEESKTKEKIILNPEVHPDRINEPDKVQKTV
jgi:hypothetical protein